MSAYRLTRRERREEKWRDHYERTHYCSRESLRRLGEILGLTPEEMLSPHPTFVDVLVFLRGMSREAAESCVTDALATLRLESGARQES